jgi:peptide/nickel transport system substrate-binding protein
MSDPVVHRHVEGPTAGRRLRRVGIALGIALAVLLSGAAAWAQGQSGGTLVWLGHQEVAGLSPNFIGPDVQAAVIFNILNPLVHVNHLTETELILANSVDVAPDGLTYTFELHEGVLFHDGTEFTAEDVKYTYEFYAQPGNTVAGRFNGMREVEVVDTYTARVHMDEVNAAFLRRAGGRARASSPDARGRRRARGARC